MFTEIINTYTNKIKSKNLAENLLINSDLYLFEKRGDLIRAAILTGRDDIPIQVMTIRITDQEIITRAHFSTGLTLLIFFWIIVIAIEFVLILANILNLYKIDTNTFPWTFSWIIGHAVASILVLSILRILLGIKNREIINELKIINLI